jgi:hypothetical protein
MLHSNTDCVKRLFEKFWSYNFQSIERYYFCPPQLASHPRDEVGHGEAVEDETKEGSNGSAGGDDPEGW